MQCQQPPPPQQPPLVLLPRCIVDQQPTNQPTPNEFSPNAHAFFSPSFHNIRHRPSPLVNRKAHPLFPSNQEELRSPGGKCRHTRPHTSITSSACPIAQQVLFKYVLCKVCKKLWFLLEHPVSIFFFFFGGFGKTKIIVNNKMYKVE